MLTDLDPDPGGLKTYGSGSGTLHFSLVRICPFSVTN
jgi:hypothetical protein